ncbi:MAG: hypothetical protein SNJ84_09950, partial [Verrucomicrobiia bacterium]
MDRVRRMVWTVGAEPLDLWAGPSTREHVPYRERPGDLSRVDCYPEVWGRLFEQRWFRIEVEADQVGGFTHLEWRDEGEATLYVDGVPMGGFDPGHRFVRLPERFAEVWVEATCCRTGIWVSGEPQGIG